MSAFKDNVGAFCIVLLLTLLTVVSMVAYWRVYGTSGVVDLPDSQGLPLSIFEPKGTRRDCLCLFLTGDGGWTTFDREIALTVAAGGIPVIGFNSLKYFWKKRSAEILARDIDRICSDYCSRWGVSTIILAGYSFGANALTFAVGQLPASVRSRIRLLALLGLTEDAEFEFHLKGWLGFSNTDARRVEPQLVALPDISTLVIYGKLDKDAPGPRLDRKQFEVIPVDGDHHLGRDSNALGGYILRSAFRAHPTGNGKSGS